MRAESGDGARDVNALAASLERHGQDVSLYAGMLLNTLSAALPKRMVTVERQRGLRFLGRGTSAAVTAVTIHVGDRRFRLERSGPESHPRATVEHIVRDIVLSSDDLPIVDWTQALAAELTEAADRDAAVARAIDLLIASPGLH